MYPLVSTVSLLLRVYLCYITIEQLPIFANGSINWVFGQVVSIYTIFRLICYPVVGVLSEKFREQYRFAFSIAIIATVFVIPEGGALVSFLKLVLGFSAFFATLYLIYSAAMVKYKEPRRIYEVFYISEKFRTLMYDLSVHVFGAGFLLLAGILIVGLINIVLSTEITGGWLWALTALSTTVVGLLILLMSRALDTKADERGRDDYAKSKSENRQT